ncbi:uncharacterized protein B0H18DRAFT_561737 [Fomitopsis serialis]|uniref:uncharacterized protein n=1 Tax=Fomitopsis serialis TaxID=139415 RepID=UPI0020077123|nr:uncharacterized protein B0H18DRAFT_561737 [Neoantrodia serialis]KAH9921463.1 hypothetical protein B0H18DRAFT_561737 [Neoantrodia serialis]
MASKPVSSDSGIIVLSRAFRAPSFSRWTRWSGPRCGNPPLVSILLPFLSRMSSQVVVDGLVKPTPGAILLGSVLSAMFFGMIMIQNRRYYENCWDESMRLKLFVALIGALNTAQMVTVTDCDWWRLINNYRVPATSSSMAWNLALGVGLTATIALMVQRSVHIHSVRRTSYLLAP